MRRLCCILTVLFAMSTALLAYTFIIKGETLTAFDGREALQLSEAERDLVLTEMRTLLSAVQQILAANQSGDVASAIKAARTAGAEAQTGVPSSLVGKLPLAFKKLGFDTHSRFDQLALDMETMDDASVALSVLPSLMNNCVTCHAAYRIDLEKM